MDNPFRYGELVSGVNFTNRREELAELEQDLRSGQNVVVMSPRRYGKTSLMLAVIERLRAQGVLVSYVDLFATPTKASFVQALAKALHVGLLPAYQQKLKTIVDAFRGLSVMPKLSLSDDGTPSLELAPGRSEADLDRDLDVLMEMPGRIAKDKGKRVVLVFDEFQEIASIDSHLVARMRTIFQHQTEVSHVYLGSKFNLMNDLFNDINAPMYKSAKTIPLHPFKREDFLTFIRERFAAIRATPNSLLILHGRFASYATSSRARRSWQRRLRRSWRLRTLAIRSCGTDYRAGNGHC
jgi:AAA+ ATPase superfamily predicted ATPase